MAKYMMMMMMINRRISEMAQDRTKSTMNNK